MATKIILTDTQISFIKDNYNQLSNKELARHLNIKISILRPQLYALGLYRMQLEFWSEDEIALLVNNYQEMGDYELAEILQAVSPRQKGWTHKHIEKKRKHMGLHRSLQELAAIKKRNGSFGYWKACQQRRWDKHGRAPDGEIRLWSRDKRRQIPFIKLKGEFTPWARWAWQQQYGAIPEGMHVAYKCWDTNRLTDINNLELISKADMAQRNSRFTSTSLSDNYVAGLLTHRNPQLRELVRADKQLLELKRQQIILERTLKQASHGRKTANTRTN